MCLGSWIMLSFEFCKLVYKHSYLRSLNKIVVVVVVVVIIITTTTTTTVVSLGS